MEQSCSPLTPFNEPWGPAGVQRPHCPGGSDSEQRVRISNVPKHSGCIKPLLTLFMWTSVLLLTSDFPLLFSATTIPLHVDSLSTRVSMLWKSFPKQKLFRDKKKKKKDKKILFTPQSSLEIFGFINLSVSGNLRNILY